MIRAPHPDAERVVASALAHRVQAHHCAPDFFVGARRGTLCRRACVQAAAVRTERGLGTRRARRGRARTARSATERASGESDGRRCWRDGSSPSRARRQRAMPRQRRRTHQGFRCNLIVCRRDRRTRAVAGPRPGNGSMQAAPGSTSFGRVRRTKASLVTKYRSGSRAVGSSLFADDGSADTSARGRQPETIWFRSSI